MIPEIAGYITRREGRKFLELNQKPEDADISPGLLRPGELLSLYIHIPFCKKLCPFCCFNRYLFNEEEARRYFINLRRELDLYIERGFTFTEFYFGGGTPTILLDELTAFIRYLQSRFKVKALSLETTPQELTAESIAVLKAAGVNRLSLGVQSFDDEMLKAMGRTLCSGKEAIERLKLAEGQFETLNIDLIFNFPFQTLNIFKKDVAVFKQLNIDQVTFYPLMPSPHKKEALERRFDRVDNSREKQFYTVILEEVMDAGFKASTAWCFSRGDRMIDEYIVDYADYIGIGAGSVSLVNGLFYVNSFSLEGYAALLAKNELPIALFRRLSEKEYLRYYLLTKLFGTQVNLKQFRQQFGADIYSKLGLELNLMKLAGGLTREGNWLRVNRRGMYIVSVMMREFFASLNTLREHCINNRV
ncbi:MAG TPA: coproporphyrinogen III oxidase family protein [Dehalococcoidales bacterium]|nr:coproporphyrinogen III oxidase family protein [Dehalococcoidales bacterium]